MMKKLTIILALTVFFALFLSGCGNSSSKTSVGVSDNTTQQTSSINNSTENSNSQSNTNANSVKSNTDSSNISSNKNQSISVESIQGIYYAKSESELYPSTAKMYEGYMIYLGDVIDPKGNIKKDLNLSFVTASVPVDVTDEYLATIYDKIFVKLYKEDNTVLFQDYVLFKHQGYEYNSEFDVNTKSGLGIIRVNITVDKNGAKIKAPGKDQIGGYAAPFKKDNNKLKENNSYDSSNNTSSTSNIGKLIGTDYCAAGMVVGKGMLQEYTSGKVKEKDITEYISNFQTSNGLTPKKALEKVKTAYSVLVSGTVKTYSNCIILNNTYMQNRTYKVVYCPYGSDKANQTNVSCYEVYDNEPSSDISCIIINENNQVIGTVRR